MLVFILSPKYWLYIQLLIVTAHTDLLGQEEQRCQEPITLMVQKDEQI